jgi:Ran GTPase-activating protein (RanGAP) involved in mRNA processing and transport
MSLRKTLTSLNLSGNEIDAASIATIASMLERSKNMRALDLSAQRQRD